VTLFNLKQKTVHSGLAVILCFILSSVNSFAGDSVVHAPSVTAGTDLSGGAVSYDYSHKEGKSFDCQYDKKVFFVFSGHCGTETLVGNVTVSGGIPTLTLRRTKFVLANCAGIPSGSIPGLIATGTGEQLVAAGYRIKLSPDQIILNPGQIELYSSPAVDASFACDW